MATINQDMALPREGRPASELGGSTHIPGRQAGVFAQIGGGADTRRIGGIGMTADEPSSTNDVFPREVIQDGLDRHPFPSMGFDGHAPPKRHGSLAQAIVLWDRHKWVEQDGMRHLWLEGTLLDNPAGNNAHQVVAAGGHLGISVRGRGEGRYEQGQRRVWESLNIWSWDVVQYAANQHSKLEVQQSIEFVDIDIIQGGGAKVEVRQDGNEPQGTPQADPVAQGLDLDAFMARIQETVKSTVKDELEARQAANTPAASPAHEDIIDSSRKELEAAKATIAQNARKSAMDKLVEETLPAYADKYDPQFREAFLKQSKSACETALRLDTDTEVGKLFEQTVEPLRKQYTEFTTAKMRAEYTSTSDGASVPQIESMKPAFEQDVGLPEYARPAHDIWQRAVQIDDLGTSSLVEQSLVGFDWGKARREASTQNMKNMFDMIDAFLAEDMNKNLLIQEYSRYEQFGGLDGIFEQTMAANAPPAQSTVASVTMRLLPTLVGSSMFTTVPVTRRKGEFPVEVYTPLGATAGDAVDTAGAMDAGTTIELGQRHVVPGSVAFTARRAAVVEGDDYAVDYSNGVIHVLEAFPAAAGDTATFNFYNLSPGENVAPTEVATGTRMEAYELDFMRDSVYITKEAEANQAGLNWSIADRSVFNAARRIEEQIDEELHLRAMMHMAQASSATTKATGANPSVDRYLTEVGLVKAAIERRRLAARYLVGHNETLASWTRNESFTRDGLPSYMLSPSNMLGRVAGLTVIASPYWTNTTDMAVMEPRTVMLLMSRQNPITVVGPERGRNNSGRLVSAREYIIEVDYQITGGYRLENVGRIKGRAA